MKWYKSLFIAFSSYSKIPMPQFAWKQEDMKYVMAFFPLVGLVIGALEYVWYLASQAWNTGVIAFCVLGALLPVLVTGGFHVDGFMDTSDALSSYRDREKRLEILKDSHVGAFAVIRLLMAAGLYLAAISILRTKGAVLVFAVSFIFSRALSALGVLHFASAVHAGSLFYTASAAQRKANTIASLIWAALSVAGMIAASPVSGILAALAGMGAFVYYYMMSKRKFGGITGDLAGYFVVVCEVAMAIGAAAGELLCR